MPLVVGSGLAAGFEISESYFTAEGQKPLVQTVKYRESPNFSKIFISRV